MQLTINLTRGTTRQILLAMRLLVQIVIVEYNSLLFRKHLCLEGFQNVRDTEAASG